MFEYWGALDTLLLGESCQEAKPSSRTMGVVASESAMVQRELFNLGLRSDADRNASLAMSFGNPSWYSSLYFNDVTTDLDHSRDLSPFGRLLTRDFHGPRTSKSG